MEHTHEEVVGALSGLLASSYTLYLKTHNFHWNVTGPMFTTLHTLFELQYTDLALAVDAIAERIRSLDAFAPGSWSEFSTLSRVKETAGRTEATQMIRTLVADQGLLADAARAVIVAAEKIGDQASADLATQRLQIHEKNAWMLRSHLE